MKILFLYLTSFSRIGGIEKFNKAIIKALKDLSENKPLTYKSLSLYDDLYDPNYVDQNYFRGFKGNKISFTFYALIQILKYDKIIIGHTNLSFLGIIAKYLGKEVIVITHGIEVWGSLSFFKRYSLKKADVLLSVSRYTKSRLIENTNINSKKIVVFPNTLDPYFKISEHTNIHLVKEKYEIPSNCKVILTVSRLCSSEKYKGYEKVLSILPELSKDISEYRYLIAGGGDDHEIARIKDLINEFELQDKVILTGEISDKELTGLYNASDVFIMPSTGEGFGIVFLEALANGLPVIAGNKDGSVDPLMDGKLGTLVDPEDSRQIQFALTKLLSINQKLSNSDYLKKEVKENFGYENFKRNLGKVLKLNI